MTVMHPHGPESQNTYWLRRVFVVVAALVTLSLLWWVVSALFGGNNDQTVTATPQNPQSLATMGDMPTPSPSPSTSSSATPSGSSSPSASASASASATPSDSASPSESTSPTPSASATCASSDVALSITGDRSPSTAKGTALSVGFTSARGCFADFSELPVSVVVTSGPDRIWTSAHCAKWAPSGIMKLAAGKEQTFTVNWPAKRSKDGCALRTDALRPGTYRATVTMGNTSKSLVMNLHG